MELLHYLRLLRRRWTYLAASTLLALTAAALATARMSPQYAASVTMVVSVPEGGGNTDSPYQAVLSSQERVKSYAQLIRSRSVTAAVAKALGDGLTAEELQRRITAQAVPETVVLRATVTDRSPVLAMRIGHTLGTEFARYVDALERSAPTGRPGVRITVADDAELPAAPVSPRPLLNLGLGLVVGLAVGVAGAVLRDLTDTSVRSVPALSEAAGAVTLGAVGYDRGLGERPLAVGADSPQAEAFRLLRTNLRFARDDDLPRSVVVTGAVPGEGTSTIACNLAVSLAETGRRVILVDADVRGSRLADYLGIDDTAGLTDVLADGTTLGAALRQWGPDSLSVLPGGSVTHRPSELLASPRMRSVLDELEARADIVILDTPPILSATDAAILARDCTGALLVTRYGSTPREQVTQAVERLETVHAQVLGAVLTFVQPSDRRLFGGAMPRLADPVEHRRLAAQR